MNPDTFYLQNQIQLELNNLKRGHVYYSIDEQPEVCARLVAEGIDTESESADEAELIDEDAPISLKMIAQRFKDARSVEGTAREITKEEIYSHRVSVTVQSWDDVPAAIGLIRERQRDFKRGMGR